MAAPGFESTTIVTRFCCCRAVDAKWVRFGRDEFTGDNFLVCRGSLTQEQVNVFYLLPQHWKQALVHHARTGQFMVNAVSLGTQ